MKTAGVVGYNDNGYNEAENADVIFSSNYT